MSKDKDLKRLYKVSLEDKLKNTIMILKYLREKGGDEEVKEYYGQAIPEYFYIMRCMVLPEDVVKDQPQGIYRIVSRGNKEKPVVHDPSRELANLGGK